MGSEAVRSWEQPSRQDMSERALTGASFAGVAGGGAPA